MSRTILFLLSLFTGLLVLVSVGQTSSASGQTTADPTTATAPAFNNIEIPLSFSADRSGADPASKLIVPIYHPVFDFDGDGRSDCMLVRNEGGSLVWYLLQGNGDTSAVTWGTGTDVLVPGDYDGDGKWDVAVWRKGAQAYFYILRSSSNTMEAIPFGITSDVPMVTQDFDGDGRADPTVIRNMGGEIQRNLVWYIQQSMLGLTAVTFGNSQQDVPLRGDFDGDGKADIAIYRTQYGTPKNTFFVLRSSDGVMQAQSFGDFGSDYIVPADFDGDRKTDFAMWRGAGINADGNWYWLQSSDGAFRWMTFGASNLDQPVVGDYDGDGKSDVAVWRPGAAARFYLQQSKAGYDAYLWGKTGDVPPAFTMQIW